jgi:uncharacterized protein YecE (DUF72 family)
MDGMQTIHIGTSGFYYEHWIGSFYPDTLPKTEWLPHYATFFKTVELNTTFYHLPKQKSLLHWLEATPDDFVFSLKAYRRITHYKKLHDVKAELLRFLHLIKPLKAKLGAILFQLPPSLRIDMPLLEQFLALLPHGYRYAIEFRHDSWLDEAVFELLHLHNVALCIDDYAKRRTPFVATADFVYIRRHGENGRYAGRYSPEAIGELADRIAGLIGGGKSVYCYFNNDFEAAACDDATELTLQLKTRYNLSPTTT